MHSLTSILSDIYFRLPADAVRIARDDLIVLGVPKTAVRQIKMPGLTGTCGFGALPLPLGDQGRAIPWKFRHEIRVN